MAHNYPNVQRLIPAAKFNIGAVLSEHGHQFSEEQKLRILNNIGVGAMTRNWDEFCSIMTHKDEICESMSLLGLSTKKKHIRSYRKRREIVALANEYNEIVCMAFKGADGCINVAHLLNMIVS